MEVGRWVTMRRSTMEPRRVGTTVLWVSPSESSPSSWKTQSLRSEVERMATRQSSAHSSASSTSASSEGSLGDTRSWSGSRLCCEGVPSSTGGELAACAREEEEEEEEEKVVEVGVEVVVEDVLVPG